MTDNLFDRLAELFQAPGPVNWRLAREIAESMAGPPQPVDPWADEQYRDLAATAQRLVTASAPFDALAAVPSVRVVDRRTWASTTVESLSYLAEPLAERLAVLGGTSGPTMPPMTGPLVGLQAGALVGIAGHRVLGRFDFGIPTASPGSAMLVAENVADLASQQGLDETAIRLWVCLHEVTFHSALAEPWVRGHLTALGRAHADEVEVDLDSVTDQLRLLQDPEAIQALVDGPDEPPRMESPLVPGAALESLAGFVAVLDGYTDVVVDRCGTDLLPNLESIRDASNEKRRQAAAGEQMMQQALGIGMPDDLAPRGRRFCRDVARRWGDDTLDRIWEGPEMLPTLDELDDATGWAARTLL